MSEENKGSKKKGCLITFLVVIVILLIAAVFLFNLPERIGLVQSPAERLLSGTPDREAAQELTSDLQSMGIDTQGINLYVIPKNDSDSSILYVELDTSQGFDFSSFSGSSNPIEDALLLLAELDKSGEQSIDRIAVNYKDETGESLATITASTEAIRGFAEGTITRQEFLQALEGKVELSQLAEEVM